MRCWQRWGCKAHTTGLTRFTLRPGAKCDFVVTPFTPPLKQAGGVHTMTYFGSGRALVALNFAPLCKVSLRRNKLAQLRTRVVAAAGL